MIFTVILLAEEQFVRSIDIVEIQCCLVLEIGGILPLLPFDRIAVGWRASCLPKGCLPIKDALIMRFLPFAVFRFRSQLTRWETFL